MALGFLAHGYATNEFEVTEERLGVYLPVSSCPLALAAYIQIAYRPSTSTTQRATAKVKMLASTIRSFAALSTPANSRLTRVRE